MPNRGHSHFKLVQPTHPHGVQGHFGCDGTGGTKHGEHRRYSALFGDCDRGGPHGWNGD